MKIKDGVIIGSAAATVAAILFAAYEIHQNRKVNDKLDKAVDYIYNHTEFEVADTLIEETTKECVEDRVVEQAKKAARDVRDDMDKIIRNEVQRTVNELKESMRDEVRNELKNKAKRVSVTDIRDEVINDVKKKAEKTIENKLDDIVENHNDQLKQVTKIYNSINKSLNQQKE